MSIRFQLLLVALTTLVLPWAGCEYARELETALRNSQENSLQASADTIANALSAQPQRVFRDPSDAQPYDPSQGDFYALPLRSQPLLDGYVDDWEIPGLPPAAVPQAFVPLASRSGLVAARLAAADDRFLFLLIDVADTHFDPEPNEPQPDNGHFDRVDVVLTNPAGQIESYFFATAAPGLIAAQHAVSEPGPSANSGAVPVDPDTLVDVDGNDSGSATPAPPLVSDLAGAPSAAAGAAPLPAAGRHIVSESRLQAYWLQTARGYSLEIRIPMSMLGGRVWIQATDGANNAQAGYLGAESLRGGRLFSLKSGLAELLATFIRQGTRATVVDRNGFKLGVSGALDTGAGSGERDPWHAWFRRFMAVDTARWPEQRVAPDRLQGDSVTAALAGLPHAEWLRMADSREVLLAAAAPLKVGESTTGAVVLEQAGEQLLDLRDRALKRLFNMTLLATALAVTFVFGFATWLGVRLRRLRTAADSAIAPDGRIRLGMPESMRSDELGDLARGFERLLGRLNEHTQYLRTLGGKLSHELRTPLTIVRSSLDNLESEGVREDQRGYVARAREGTLRLQSILSALGAAARTEEAIKQAERVNFDLCEVLRSAVEGYRLGFRGARIEVETPFDSCYFRGAPDLIVQLLDKLVENAVDFCPLAGTIAVRLRRVEGEYELAVINDGPPIPDPVIGHLFESLFEQRQGHDDRPHFGLGLYIVRLIAEFHGGTARAANRPEASGAMFTVTLPMI